MDCIPWDHSSIQADALKAILNDSSSDIGIHPIEQKDEEQAGSNIENEEEDNDNDQFAPRSDDDDSPSQWLNRTSSFWKRQLNYNIIPLHEYFQYFFISLYIYISMIVLIHNYN